MFVSMQVKVLNEITKLSQKHHDSLTLPVITLDAIKFRGYIFCADKSDVVEAAVLA